MLHSGHVRAGVLAIGGVWAFEEMNLKGCREAQLEFHTRAISTRGMMGRKIVFEKAETHLRRPRQFVKSRDGTRITPVLYQSSNLAFFDALARLQLRMGTTFLPIAIEMRARCMSLQIVRAAIFEASLRSYILV